MAGERAYWSVDDCGWKASPGVPDALVTPWSAHGLGTLSGVPHPQDADDLLRRRRRGPLPGQRPTSEQQEPAHRV